MPAFWEPFGISPHPDEEKAVKDRANAAFMESVGLSKGHRPADAFRQQRLAAEQSAALKKTAAGATSSR